MVFTNWLKGTGSMTWAAFIQTDNELVVRVVALIGASRYIDRDMPIEEARDEHRKLYAAGWRNPLPDLDPPDLRTLRLWIYD